MAFEKKSEKSKENRRAYRVGAGALIGMLSYLLQK
jgi:hypothetical protein